MKKRREIPPQHILVELLEFDAETGNFRWLPRDIRWFSHLEPKIARAQKHRWNAIHAGQPALSSNHNSGYLEGAILGQRHLAHRVAWKIWFGCDPVGEIDHINQVRSDNRICNLRSVSHQKNLKNQRKSSANTSGVTGVSWHKKIGMWQANIRVSGDLHHLGYFDNLDMAASARKTAERQFGFHMNHGSQGGFDV